MKRDMTPGGTSGDPRKEVREEIDFYLEQRARDFEAAGMNPDEARRAAAGAFGDKEQIEAELGRIRRGRERDEGRSRIMASLTQDLKLTFRGLRKRPGFTTVVVGTLALGTGASRRSHEGEHTRPAFNTWCGASKHAHGGGQTGAASAERLIGPESAAIKEFSVFSDEGFGPGTATRSDPLA